uniref:Uncharacterized protein n=1 Tax=uncultured marine virus TaxID=186617 RepID=A0A0F7L8E3_9VIRU|nr:hypothetical protein [uncultured marine virus]
MHARRLAELFFSPVASTTSARVPEAFHAAMNSEVEQITGSPAVPAPVRSGRLVRGSQGRRAHRAPSGAYRH